MRVLFVNMPFSDLKPSIGISLLKSHLATIGVESDIEYLNLDFAALIDTSTYRFLSTEVPSLSLLGDYIFSKALFQRSEASTQEYFDRCFREYLAPDKGTAIGQLTFFKLPVSSYEEFDRICALGEPFVESCFQRIDWSRYDIVGFTTTFAQNTASLALARRVKEQYPETRIVFGGANCESEMGLQLHRSFPFVDYVCSGEADISFVELVRRLESGEDVLDIDGIIARREGASVYRSLTPQRVADLDLLPYPNYDDFFAQVAAKQIDSINTRIPVETSRGCWWGEKQHCTFCGLNGLTMTFRSKSPQRALEEFSYLCARYDTKDLFVVDNILNMRYLKDLLPELKTRDLGLDLFYETKANLSKDQLRLFRDAGIARIQPGIESLSSHVLHLMRKGTTALQNIQMLKWCRELGIFPSWNILYGFPGELAEDYAAAVPLVESIHHLDPPLASAPIRLDRFSPYFQASEQYGITNVRPAWAYRYVYDLPDDHLNNLVYYFEYDYANGQDPSLYVTGLLDAVRAWIVEYAWGHVVRGKTGTLVYKDDGMTLTITDTRKIAIEQVTELTGWERDLYLYCDQNRSAGQIVTRAESFGRNEAEVMALLRRLIDHRLMLTADGRYLSLALEVISTSPVHEEALSSAGAPA